MRGATRGLAAKPCCAHDRLQRLKHGGTKITEESARRHQLCVLRASVFQSSLSAPLVSECRFNLRKRSSLNNLQGTTVCLADAGPERRGRRCDGGDADGRRSPAAVQRRRPRSWQRTKRQSTRLNPSAGRFVRGVTRGLAAKPCCAHDRLKRLKHGGTKITEESARRHQLCVLRASVFQSSLSAPLVSECRFNLRKRSSLNNLQGTTERFYDAP